MSVFMIGRPFFYTTFESVASLTASLLAWLGYCIRATELHRVLAKLHNFLYLPDLA
jgi:hypothetical protein